MTAAAAITPSDASPSAGPGPAGWQELRADENLQFAPVTIPEIPPRQPGWLEQALNDLGDLLADLLAPVGEALGANWWWLQWAVAGLVAVFALVLLLRLFDPALLRRGRGASRKNADAEEWRPETAASLALLEDADRLAAQGRFEEATRLLLQRSVGQIAAARPGWVEPSSTARELAALPELPAAARAAFGVIAARVEASLFALRRLERADWEAARAAYAEFALTRLVDAAGGAAR